MIIVDACISIVMIIFFYLLVVYLAECMSQNSVREYANQNYYLTIFFFFFVCWISARFIFSQQSRASNKNIQLCMYVVSVLFVINSLVFGWNYIEKKVKIILIILIFCVLCYYSYERSMSEYYDEDDED